MKQTNNEVSHNPAAFHVGLKVLLVNDKKEFLLLKAISKNNEWHDSWDLPGGRINKDELDIGFHEIIDREIKEEAGDIKYQLRPDPVSLAKCSYPEDNEDRFFILFEAKYISGKITLCEEHSDYVWQKIDKGNVKKYFHKVFEELMDNYFKWNPHD